MREKDRLIGDGPLDIVLAEIGRILYLRDDDMLYIYEGDDYEDYDSSTGKSTYETPLFSIGCSEIKLGCFLNPHYALARVWNIQHCDDGIFRVALEPGLWRGKDSDSADANA